MQFYSISYFQSLSQWRLYVRLLLYAKTVLKVNPLRAISFCNAKVVFFLTILGFLSQKVSAQHKIDIFLYNKVSGLAIAGAEVKADAELGTTDSVGHVLFYLKKGVCKINIESADYQHSKFSLKVDSAQVFKRYLIPRQGAIAEVVVANSGSKNAGSTLTAKDLEKVPVFMGQKDPLRLLQTLPGIANAGDGNSGLFIRGGTSGQNLTLFNHAVVYNPAHLLGFFSVFNGEGISKMKLYKSGIPSEYGGRLSSVLEVLSKNRASDSLSFAGNVSLLGADISALLPVTKKISLNTSLRKTFMGLTVWPLLSSLQNEHSNFNKVGYDFFDVTLGLSYQVNSYNEINYSSFVSGDDFNYGIRRFDIDNKMDWGNLSQSLVWKSFFKAGAYLTTLVTNSNYRFNFGMQQDRYEAKITSNIEDYSVKSFLVLPVASHELKLGAEYVKHRYRPNTPYVKNAETVYDFGASNTYHSDESAVFISDDWRLTHKISLNPGVRITHYRNLGPYFVVNEDGSTVDYGKGQKISAFTYAEPSLGFTYKLSSAAVLKSSLSYNVQPVHLISVTAVNFPADFWMPSTGNLKPQKGYQASTGLFYNHPEQHYEASVDFYYKEMKGLSEFSGGIMNLIDNLKIEEHLLFGRGNAYGAEFFLKKKYGKLSGWLSYTLAWNNRKFPLINAGQSFPSKYDRRHDLTVLAAYRLNKRWQFNSTFNFATGNTYTKPVSRYMISGNIVNEYGPFNGNRMPAYHRLDLSANCLLKARAHQKSELVFSVYNVYSRLNPIYIYFMAEGDLESYRVSVSPKPVSILPVLPSLSYRYTFR